MAEVVTVYIRGESGTVKPHDLPLPWPIADRLAKGILVEVDGPDDPAALTAPEDSPIVAAAEAEKAEQGRLQADADRAEVEDDAEPETPETPEPERKLLTRPPVNNPKSDWAAWAKQVDPDLTDDDIKATTKEDLIKRY
jgi:hypothetical protein